MNNPDREPPAGLALVPEGMRMSWPTMVPSTPPANWNHDRLMVVLWSGHLSAQPVPIMASDTMPS